VKAFQGEEPVKRLRKSREKKNNVLVRERFKDRRKNSSPKKIKTPKEEKDLNSTKRGEGRAEGGKTVYIGEERVDPARRDSAERKSVSKEPRKHRRRALGI